MRWIFAALLISLSASPALACYEPSAPSCADRYGEFEDQDDFDRCKRDMEDYQDEVDSFLQCVRSEVDDHRRAIDEKREEIEESNREIDGHTQEIKERVDKANAVTTDYNAAVEAFNRRARY